MKKEKLTNEEKKMNKLKDKERALVHKEMLKKATEDSYNEKIAPEGFAVSLKNINKIYPNHVQAVYDFNLDIKEKEFIVLVGPSGCGKSTTLRMVAGLESITYGDLYISGVFANNLPPKNRDIAMVFQNYALYPNMSVYDNLAFGLQARHVPKEEIKEKVLAVAETLELSDYLDRKPGALSGGQRQRVALGRAIVRNAKVFLMDEPLSNLDAKLRVQMRSEIVKIHRRIGSTTIYVTHDQTEAMTMADRIVVMNKGYVQQIGTPKEIYNNPANLFVATFIGSPAMNIINATYDNGVIQFKNGFEIKLDKEKTSMHDAFYQKEIAECNERIKVLNDELNAINESVVTDKKTKLLNEEKSSILSNKLEEENSLLDYLSQIDKEKKHDIKFGVRPENIAFNEEISLVKNQSPRFKLEIVLSELLGNEYYIHSMIGGEEIIAKVGAENALEDLKEIEVVMNLNHIHIFDMKTKKKVL